MGLIFMIIFVGVYIYEFNYYSENNLSYTCPIIAIFLLLFQFLAILNDINIPYSGKYYENDLMSFLTFLSYYLGFFANAIIAIFITCIPIYKDKRGFNNKSLISHYINILKTKNGNCTREDYWFFFGVLIITILVLIIVKALLELFSYYNFDDLYFLIFLALGILDLIFQAKRLNDACVSKWFLLIRLSSLLGYSFGLVSYIVILAILCLPSKEIPTTNLAKDKKEIKE